MLKLRCAVALLTHQIEKDARVEIAAARAHHDATDGREAHRGVYGMSIPDGNQARAVSEMGDDRPRQGSRAEHADDVLVRESVKAVMPQLVAPERARERKALSQLRHISMKCRIEARNLWHLGIALGHRLDDLDLRGEMQWRKRYQPSQRGEQRFVDPLRCPMGGPAMHQPVPDRRGLG